MESHNSNNDQGQVNQPVAAHHPHVYSTSGLDLLGILMRVANRPKPEYSLGAVDLSSAIVVSDATKDDMPIVHCTTQRTRSSGRIVDFYNPLMAMFKRVSDELT